MKFFPDGYNGFLFQNTGRVESEFLDYDWDIGGLQTQNAQRLGKRPKYSGVVYSGAVKVVHVVLRKPEEDRDALVIAMDVGGDQQHELFSLDELGRKWYVMAKCVGLNVEDNDGKTTKYGYIFDVDDPTWIMVKENEDTWDVMEDEETHVITVPGNQPTYPAFDITLGAPPDDYYLYVEYIKNYNPIARTQVDGIDITDGGWDTAALVADNKMQESGADVRVIFDGAEYPFEVGGDGWNSTNTRIFIRAAWLPGQSMKLRTELPALGTPSKIEWQVTPATKRALKKLPLSSIIRVGNEEISYRNLSVARCEADIVERNIRGTTIALHAVGSVCWWVEHDIRIVYGNSTAEAPEYDNPYRPIFELDTSTNTSRVLTVFADAGALRVGSWNRQEINDGIGKRSRVYSGNSGAIADADPATSMGMELASYQANGKNKPETADMAWMFYHAARILTIITTADKYKAFTTTTWPNRSGLESSVNGTKWVVEWDEAAPSTAGAFVSIAHTALETLATNTHYIRYRLAGSINRPLNNVTRLEVHTLTLTLNPADVIQVGMSGENPNYQLSIEIRNNTTKQSLFIDYPVAEDETISVDTEKMKAIYKGINAIRAISWDSIRTDWLQFAAGENELQIFGNPALGEVSIVTRLHGRGL